MSDHQEETTTARREVFSGRLLRVYVDDVDLPGGGHSSREVVEHPGAVAIVASDGDGRILLVRQWRHPLRRALWEIPAGTREPGEPVEVTARRELEEETGYAAASWQALGVAASSPGFSSEETHFFAARQLTEGAAHADDDENLEARLFTPAEIGALIAAGDVDTKTIAGLALAGYPVASPG